MAVVKELTDVEKQGVGLKRRVSCLVPWWVY